MRLALCRVPKPTRLRTKPMTGFNHSVSCLCGWCTMPRGASDDQVPQRHLSRYGSVTVPNARCSLCSSRVFFYESELGGRVLFDALGPPWPKHSCDRDQSSASQEKSADWSARRASFTVDARRRQRADTWFRFQLDPVVDGASASALTIGLPPMRGGDIVFFSGWGA